MVITASHRGFWNRVHHRIEQHPMAHLTGLYILCIAMFLITIPMPHVDGQLVGSDGAFYYAYLPTLLIDHDLDFGNQYARLVPAKTIARLQLSAAGKLPNKQAIGSAILWMPFFLIGHLLAIVLKAAGYSIRLDGIGYIYQVPTLIGSISYGFAGLLLIYRSCRRFFNPFSSASATMLIWLATGLIYYMVAEPSMSHACSLFAVALFLELWLRFRPVPLLHQWILLGLGGGLVALVRLQDATWLALPVIDALLALRFQRRALIGQLKGLLVFGMATVIVFLPQIAVWWILNASAATGYQDDTGLFFWFMPKILKVLFSYRHGLYTWHPVLLFATAGLAFLYRKDRGLPILLGFMFALQVCLIGAWVGWSGGDAFGGRMFISSIPALALGLAAFVDWGIERGALRSAGILASALITWNALLFIQYRLGYISKSKAITLHQLIPGALAVLRDTIHNIQMMFR